MNTSTPDNNGYQPPANDWVPPAQQSPKNGNHGGQKFFQSIRRCGFFRSESRWVGGVAGGLARRLNVDPLVVRVVFILLGIVTTGFALLAYAAAWALLPEERDGRIHAEEAIRGNFDGALIVIGLAAVMGFGSLGSVFLFAEALPGPLVGLLWFAFVGAIGYVVYVIHTESQKKSTQNTPQGPPTPGFAEPIVPQPPVAGSATEASYSTQKPSPSTSTAIIPVDTSTGGIMNDTQTNSNSERPASPHTADGDTLVDGDADSGVNHGIGHNGNDQDTTSEAAQTDWTQPQNTWSDTHWSDNAAGNNAAWDDKRGSEWTPPAPQPAQPKGQFAIGFGLTLVLAAVLLGAVHFGYLEQGSVALSLVVSIAIILGGLMVMVNGLRGRTSGGAGFFSIIVLISALFFGITGVAGANFKAQNFTGISSQSLTPQSIAEVEGGFSFGVGDLHLDLTQIPLSEFAERSEPLDIGVSGGVGEISVVFPSTLNFNTESSLGAGEYTDPYQNKSSRVVGTQSYSQDSSSNLTDAPEVNMKINLGLGNIDISGVSDSRTFPGEDPTNTLTNTESEVNR